MIRICFFTTLILASSVLPTTRATAQQGLRALVEFQRTSAGETTEVMTTEFIRGQNQLRLNTEREGERMSVIFRPNSMLMIHHQRRMYVEMPIPPPTPQVPSEPEAAAPSEPEETDECRFRALRRSGREETINGWRAREVQAVDGARVCMSFWMSSQVPVGLIEVFQNMATEMRRRGGGASRSAGAAAGLARRFEQLRRIGRLPRGSIVRVHNPAEERTVTLMRVSRSPVTARDFEPPAGYTAQRIPGRGSYPLPRPPG